MLKMTGQVIDVAWSITVLDINKTLRRAVDKLFRDKAVSDQVRKIRAQGMYRMGKTFEKFGENSDKGLEELKKQISGQFDEAAKMQQAKAEHEKAAAQEEKKE